MVPRVQEAADPLARPRRRQTWCCGARLALAALLVGTSCGEETPPNPAPDSLGASDGLVYIGRVAGSNEVVRLRLSDGATRAVTETPGQDERWPYWSGAAQQLLFQVSTAGGRSDLMLWSPHSQGAIPLRQSPQRDERWPAWSPDGKQVAYAFRGGRPSAGIALQPLPKGRTQLLAVSGPRDFFFRPSFAPDGSRLVAQRRGRDGEGSNLWLLAPATLPARLTADADWFDMKPRFTRAGDTVVFTRGPASGGPRDIVAIAAAGGPVRHLAGTPESDDHSGRPSPSRDEVAFVSDRDGDTDLFLIELEGGEPRPLTRTPDRHEYAPRWSPDGERIVVTVEPVGGADVERAAARRITVLDREGRVLADVPGSMPDWMPPWP